MMWTTSSVVTSGVSTTERSVMARKTVMMDQMRRIVPPWCAPMVNGPVKRSASVFLRGTTVTEPQIVRMKVTSRTAVSKTSHPLFFLMDSTKFQNNYWELLLNLFTEN